MTKYEWGLLRFFGSGAAVGIALTRMMYEWNVGQWSLVPLLALVFWIAGSALWIAR